VGHATTLVALGLPIVMFKAYLPDAAQQVAEALIGVVIVALAARVLMRWRAGRFHVHSHRHGSVEHRHLHPHTGAGHDHRHEPQRRLGRSPVQAYCIGLVHGVAGSGGVGVLLLAGIPDRATALFALGLFAAATALSMAALSWILGYVLTRGSGVRRAFTLAPALGVASLLFGVWYTLAALYAVGKPL
jgi:ABC-type nickel/cobalt efflux system permease component RcnA